MAGAFSAGLPTTLYGEGIDKYTFNKETFGEELEHSMVAAFNAHCDIAKSMEKISNTLSRCADTYESFLQFTKSQEYLIKTKEVFCKLGEIADYLNDCCLKGIEIDTSILDDISFKPYSLKQWENDFNSYVSYVRENNNISLIKEKRNEILSLIPECFSSLYNEFFPLSVEYKLVTNYRESGYCKKFFNGGRYNKTILEDGSCFTRDHTWVPTFIDGSGSNRKKLNINFSGYLDSGEVTGTFGQRIGEIWYPGDVFTEEQRKNFQNVCVIDMIENYGLEELDSEDFYDDFYEEYYNYLDETLIKYSAALLNLKGQLPMAIEKKRKFERETMCLSLNEDSVFDSYSDEELGSLFREFISSKKKKSKKL